jgi:hypothetical protein
MKIKIELSDDQIDEIVANAIREAHPNVCGVSNYGTPEETLAMSYAMQLVYSYFTGKEL